MLADEITWLMRDGVLTLAPFTGELILVVFEDSGGDVVVPQAILLGGALRGRRRASD